MNAHIEIPRYAMLALLLLFVAPACGSLPLSGEPTPFLTYEADPLPTERDALFSGSGACTSCHTDMVDQAGNDVSIDDNWRAAIMANASRDPYWQATVRSEVLDHPALRTVIEDKCASCHTPMAHFSAVVSQTDTALLDGGFLDPDHPRHALAIDGVSCTLCHQIEEQGLGDPDSFSGGFSIDTQQPRGERLIYGPFPAARRPAAVMQDASGYLPVKGPQTLRSEMCATCHTLYTPYVDESGEIAGTFPEQVPYLEWQHSDYEETHSCQDCHMPPAEGGVRLSTIGGGPPRSPFGRHLFIGGNTYILKMLWAFGDEFEVTASGEHFSQKVEQSLAQLQERTATVAIEEADRTGSTLAFAVVVRSRTGHKFPTGYPSRRAWLHVTVKDAGGEVIFESGAPESRGAVLGNDNDADPTAYEPHYEEITLPDQVQIYEALLEDVSGEVTTALLRATGYRKDNRLLPPGFDKASAGEDFAVHGGAADDDDFIGGSDTTRYLIDLSEAEEAAALTVKVEFCYQSIGYRWVDNLGIHDAAEITRFLDAYDDLPNEPVIIDTTTLEVKP